MKKAFFEAVLYFLRESEKNKNPYLKHIIITNAKEWFIFDAITFRQLIPKELEQYYKDFEINPTLFKNKTEDFYKAAKDVLEKNIPQRYDYVYIDINKKFTDNQLKTLFKFFSPEHLLKEFVDVDANSLNKNFYYELLYILGLKEIKMNGKYLIQRGYITGSMMV